MTARRFKGSVELVTGANSGFLVGGGVGSL
jgi:hypothetical protein